MQKAYYLQLSPQLAILFYLLLFCCLYLASFVCSPFSVTSVSMSVLVIVKWPFHKITEMKSCSGGDQFQRAWKKQKVKRVSEMSLQKYPAPLNILFHCCVGLFLFCFIEMNLRPQSFAMWHFPFNNWLSYVHLTLPRLQRRLPKETRNVSVNLNFSSLSFFAPCRKRNWRLKPRKLLCKSEKLQSKWIWPP